MRLATALLFVKDIDRMTRFYGEAMALPVCERSAGWASFRAGGVLLGLHAIPSEIAARITIGVPPEPRSENPMKLVFETPDVLGARAALEAAGAVMFEPHGQDRCDGLDPEGNVFQIARSVNPDAAAP